MQIALQKNFRRLSILLIVAVMAGCQSFEFPGVYKINIQQGNIITQEMVDQLEPGMSTRQVRYIMGNPLIQDTFNPNRWDYYYHLQRPNGSEAKEMMSIFFEDDKLVSFNGDYIPSSANPDSNDSSSTTE